MGPRAESPDGDERVRNAYGGEDAARRYEVDGGTAARYRGRAAILSLVGFLATIFCYLGVNLVLSGLHSYGGG